MQTYDPAHLVREIQIHLDLQGLVPHLPDEKKREAHTAASQLLLALGITPAIDGVEALARASDRTWSEID